MWSTSTHTHDTEDAQPHGVKTEHKSVDAACKTTSTARHRKPQHHHWINIYTRLHGTTPTLGMETYLVMLMPWAKIVWKTMTHSSGSTLLCCHEVPHTKGTTYPKFQTHERTRQQQQRRPISKEQLATLDTTRFLGTFFPTVCRTRNN